MPTLDGLLMDYRVTADFIDKVRAIPSLRWEFEKNVCLTRKEKTELDARVHAAEAEYFAKRIGVDKDSISVCNARNRISYDNISRYEVSIYAEWKDKTGAEIVRLRFEEAEVSSDKVTWPKRIASRHEGIGPTFAQLTREPKGYDIIVYRLGNDRFGIGKHKFELVKEYTQQLADIMEEFRSKYKRR
jgi:hypothetical protein